MNVHHPCSNTRDHVFIDRSNKVWQSTRLHCQLARHHLTFANSTRYRIHSNSCADRFRRASHGQGFRRGRHNPYAQHDSVQVDDEADSETSLTRVSEWTDTCPSTTLNSCLFLKRLADKRPTHRFIDCVISLVKTDGPL